MYHYGWPLAIVGFMVCSGSSHAQSAAPGSSRAMSTSQEYVNEVGGKTLEQWMRELKNPDPSVRTQAILHIVQFGDQAAQAVPLIIDRCRDRDPSPRVKAVMALKIIHIRERDIPRVVEALTQRLQEDGQQIVRYEAAAGLLRFGTEARPAMAALARNATDRASTWELRYMSIMALRAAAYDPQHGPDPRAVRAFMDALLDPVAQVRLEAVISLGAIGRPTDPRLLGSVIHILQGLQTSKDKTVSMWSYVALLAMDEKMTDKSIRAILRYLQSPDSELRQQVLRALAAIGIRARTCVPDVLEIMDDRDPAVVAMACFALGHISEYAPKVTEALIAASRRKEPNVVWGACDAMGNLGVASPEVIAALEQVMQRKDVDELFIQQVRQIRDQLRKGPKKQ